nr:MAG TPA: hypothetical protein [Caudoviricetes sp.]
MDAKSMAFLLVIRVIMGLSELFWIFLFERLNNRIYE